MPPLSCRKRPCLNCQQRKIRCDKTDPCAHCAKTSRSCRYDRAGEDVTTDSLESISDLRYRLSRLESMIAAMKSASNIVEVDDGLGAGERSAENRNAWRQERSPPGSSESPTVYVGKQIFEEGASLYLHPSSWIMLLEQVSPKPSSASQYELNRVR
jgi:Fungal Zn(2)-Cys(6) binuclear cluster domain